jgi:hypothetical protein
MFGPVSASSACGVDRLPRSVRSWGAIGASGPVNVSILLAALSLGSRRESPATMLNAEVDLRVVQIAARHADPRTTMRYDRARKNLDRHPNYILAAFMASAT